MRRKSIVLKALVVLACFFLLSASSVLAQDACEGNFDCDQDVDGTDAAVFKSDFGRSQFSNPCPTCQDSPCPCTAPGCDPPAPVEKTGQTTCYDSSGSVISCTGTGQDGEYQKGVAWPNPRFTDNGDGTITDNLTGLIWLKDASCFGTRAWANALSDANGLADGSCGLTDGSSAGDWRLPNSNELASLVHKGYYDLALPNTAGTGQWSAGDPFDNVQSGWYWSSTTYEGNPSPSLAWVGSFLGGHMELNSKHNYSYVWPVRGDND